MSALFIERRKVRHEMAYCVSDGVRLLGACMTEAAAQELLDASLLASTAILRTPIPGLRSGDPGPRGHIA